MPLYEYECSSCHRHTEKIQKFSDPEITVCPFCGGALSRVISAPAFALKGGGWYADGYGAAKPAATTGESSASGESKPAAAAPAAAADASPATPSATPAAPKASSPTS